VLKINKRKLNAEVVTKINRSRHKKGKYFQDEKIKTKKVLGLILERHILDGTNPR
jgi:hypothetical protein